MGDISTPDENGSVPKAKASEYPADTGESTESDSTMETGEVQCTCEKHYGKVWLNEVYSLSVDQLFTFMFSDSKFMADLMQTRKTTDMVIAPWQLDEETGHKTRQLSYTLALNNALAKTAPSTDQQRLLKESKAGKMYMVCCDIANTGVPYCDSFSVQSQYCLTRVSSQQCRIQIYSIVNYKKSLWGVVKSMIEKTAMQGVQDFVKDLDIALKREGEQNQTPGKRRPRLRPTKQDAKSETINTKIEALPPQPSISKISEAPSSARSDVGGSGLSPELVIKVILGVLGALIILNGMLFYKLWALEDHAGHLTIIPATIEIPMDSKNQSPENLLHLMKQQEGLHRVEIDKWTETLKDITKFLRLMENSLSDLKSSIESYRGSAIAKLTNQVKGQARAEKQ